MKVDRYEIYTRFDGSVELVIDPKGSVCYTSDVAKLEALNVELLEPLERCFDLMNNGGTWSLDDQAAARAAIAKAKGEQP